MGQDAELRCRCGEVHGIVTDASPRTTNRVVCYCDDCQAFAHYLGRADLLDPHGGTGVIQVAPGAIRFDRGQDRIVGIRLTPKGLHRFYTECCKTPVGNATPRLAFVGVVDQAFGSAAEVDARFGAPVGRGFGKFALGNVPDAAKTWNMRLVAHALKSVLGWHLAGKAWPHPYFDRQTKAELRPVKVLSTEERDALRPLCGPRPTRP
jgi:hypothetical protein